MQDQKKQRGTAERRWVTRNQVADILQVSIATLERWGRSGIGPKAYRLAGQRLLRYDADEVSAFVQREGA